MSKCKFAFLRGFKLDMVQTPGCRPGVAEDDVEEVQEGKDVRLIGVKEVGLQWKHNDQ